ncbi:non-ribosomal peptide synthetase [Streptomyces sp. DSM 15324]|uniref:non-ribosomal peptide synthetase n=1 Tax=Streptomyces sp. DSM 15324 TaxID=1739111 RepID=UPI000748D012|nr:non-ribosomal peptide synthetase [Streptomyces sp. DSM 15324]KUO09532.1 hypothetical protein AQJ58_24570 [Streptomyces sp. DSM 15324]
MMKAPDRFEHMRDLLAEILADVLGVNIAEIDRDKDFFEIGGSSVLVPEVAMRISESFGVQATSTLLYENPEIDELAQAIIGLQDNRGAQDAYAGGVTPRTDRLRAPASFGQQQLWLLEQLAPEACAYNVVAGYRLRGSLSMSAFRRALRAVIARHEVLRVVFDISDGLLTQVIQDAEPVIVQVEDDDQDWALVEQRTPFDLAAGPLLRARVVRHGHDDHTIYLAMHHIITDDFSSTLMIRELSAFYTEFVGGPAAEVPALAVQYGDMAVWQREQLTASAAAAELDYWRSALDGVPVTLDLPTDRPRPAVQSFAGAVLRRPLGGGTELLSKAATLGKRVGATPFMVMISAFGALLSAWSGAEDVVVGTPIADRDGPDRQSMLGFLLNTVAMRLRTPSHTTFLALVDQVRTTALGAYAHQALPFDRVVDMIAPDRELSRNPLAQVMFILHTEGPESLNWPGLRSDLIDIPSVTSKFDITLSLIPQGDALIAEWEYATDIFDRGTIEFLAASFDALLDTALSEPEVPVAALPAPIRTDLRRPDADLPVLAVPSDRPRPSPSPRSAAQHSFSVDADVTKVFQAFAADEGLPESAVLTATYQTLLARLCHADESIVGTILPASPTQLAGEDDLVHLRTSIGSTEGMRGVARRIADTSANLLKHRDEPNRRVSDKASATGVSPAMVVYGDSCSSSIDLSAVLAIAQRSDSDLALFAEIQDGRLSCTMDYNKHLFEPERVEHWCAMLAALLRAGLADPDAPVARLPLGTTDDTTRAVGPECDISCTVVDLIDAAIGQWPDRIACVHEGTEWTFREFDQRVRMIMSAMRSAGWSSASVIGVAVDRGVDLPASLLAVLRLGAAYLPLASSQPAQRTAAMLTDAGCTHVLGSGPDLQFEDCASIDVTGDLDGRYVDAEFEAPTVDQPAYVIFTSGSTGRPKGVQVPHRALASVLRSFAGVLGFEAGERWISVTRPTFDIAALELFLPLAFGGELEIASEAASADPKLLADRLSAGGVDVVQGTPTLWRAVIDEGWRGTPGLRALCGGEELTRDLADKLVNRADRVWNVYGPTETTIWSTIAEVTAGPLSIGTVLPGEYAYVADEFGMPLPPYVVGELCIGGVGVADGYVNREDLVAERFILDPVSRCGRVYRTGDLVELRPDGSFTFHGRSDQQVKLRGHRIEPGEIESVLRAAPGVADAAVVLRQDAVLGAELVAFAQPDASGVAVEPADLGQYCADRLPATMVPARISLLAELPTTSSGKIDRSALVRAAAAKPEPSDDRTRADSAVEHAVAGVFAELLGIVDIPANTSFFALGGHSLTAARAVNRLQEMGFSLALRDLFAAPTVRGLAALLLPGVVTSGIPRIDRDHDLPLTFVQERIWFDAQLNKASSHYNIGGAVRMKGRLDIPVLEAQFRTVVGRHETLRSSFSEVAGVPVQQIVGDLPVGITVTDVSEHADPMTAAQQSAAAFIEMPFQLDVPPLLRLRLYRLASDDHLLVVCIHHIVADGWSMGVLVSEVMGGYAAAVGGKEFRTDPLPVRYRDFAEWERDPARVALIDDQLGDVVGRLRDFPTYSSIPLDRLRPKQAGYAGGTVRNRLTAEVTRTVRDIAVECESTVHSVLMAGFAATLHRHGAGSELVLACPSSNRPHRDVEGLIGAFVNTLPVPISCRTTMSFVELVAQVTQSMVTALHSEHVPFDRVVTALGVPRNLAFSPLTQIAFVSQNAPMPEMRMPGLVVEQVPLDPGVALYDLRLAVTEQDGGVDLQLDYDTSVLDESTARLLLDRYAESFALLAAQAQPGNLPFPMVEVTPADDVPAPVAPRTEVERTVAGVWAELLRTEADALDVDAEQERRAPVSPQGGELDVATILESIDLIENMSEEELDAWEGRSK